ncbi:MAG: pitrilysin family protein, partial [Myxococcota bacterium]
PTIGWMKDLNAITLDDCLAFYRTFYAPNNAALVIVGDIASEQALALVNAYYGHMPAAELPDSEFPEEPPQERERRRLLTMPLSSPKLLYGYRTPEMKAPDHAALQVLHQILLEGRSSRLYQRLVVKDETVAEASGWVGEFADPSLYEILLTLKPDADREQVEHALDAELARLRETQVTERELLKAQNQLEAQALRQMQSMGDRAYGLGHTMTTMGTWLPLFTITEHIRAVTADDVQAVARTYLKRNNRSVIIAVPQPIMPAPASAPDAGEEAP